jgi:hypothetical protein
LRDSESLKVAFTTSVRARKVTKPRDVDIS